jgi:hypothetical protein
MKVLAVTLATFYGVWVFHAPPDLRWKVRVPVRTVQGLWKEGRVLHAVDGRVLVQHADTTDDASPLELMITDASVTGAGRCYRFLLPPTFERPKRLMRGTVAPCDDDSATAAFVGRRR